MKSDIVIQAARLLEQLEKIDMFIDQAPEDAENLTLTLRKGKYSKSVTLSNQHTIVEIRNLVNHIRNQTAERIQELGIELDSTHKSTNKG